VTFCFVFVTYTLFMRKRKIHKIVLTNTGHISVSSFSQFLRSAIHTGGNIKSRQSRHFYGHTHLKYADLPASTTMPCQTVACFNYQILINNDALYYHPIKMISILKKCPVLLQFNIFYTSSTHQSLKILFLSQLFNIILIWLKIYLPVMTDWYQLQRWILNL
jgi:hypothetical protein